MSTFDEVHILSIKIFQKIEKSYYYAIALKTIFDFTKEGKYNGGNEFIELSKESMIYALFLEISKMFDKSEMKKSENCSLLRLQKICGEELRLKDKQQSIDEKFEYILDKWNNDYSTIKNARNKLIAHNDLNAMFLFKSNTISIEEILVFIDEIADLVNYVFESFLGVKFSLDKEKIALEYRKSFSQFLNL